MGYHDIPGNQSDVRSFLYEAVPVATARLACKAGVIRSIPVLSQRYISASPAVPVLEFKSEILRQIRSTTALSILMMFDQGTLVGCDPKFRRALAAILEQFDNDSHWETFKARGLAHHVDRQCAHAEAFYDRSISIIRGDKNVCEFPAWKNEVRAIQELKDRAHRSKGPTPAKKAKKAKKKTK